MIVAFSIPFSWGVFSVVGCTKFLMSLYIKNIKQKLFRDCIRLVQHIAPGSTSGKSNALRNTVRNEFRKNRMLQTEDEIIIAKAAAIRALSNYMLTNSARKDPKLHIAMKEYHGRSVKAAKEQQQQ